VDCQVHPVGINYQAVAQNAQGIEITSANLGVRFSILLNDPNGILEWQETHNVTTSNFGLFTAIIGQGNRTDGTATVFDSIHWGSGTHYLRVEINFGSGYLDLGTTQMTAVPYALYADKAGNAMNSISNVITYDSASYTLLSNGIKIADLSNIKNDAIQNMSLNGNTLSLSQSTATVDLSKYSNSPQNLNLTGNSLSLSQSADTIDLSKYNYTPQNLSLSGNSLTLSQSADTINLSKYLYTSNIVAFSVNCSDLKFETVNPQEVSFPSNIYDNTGSFNLTNFTAPQTGAYFFSLNLYFLDQNQFIVTILKNGTAFQTYPSITQQTFSSTIIIYLSVNDSVSIQITNSYAPITLSSGCFSGYMIH
jgi:hypothetical protein